MLLYCLSLAFHGLQLLLTVLKRLPSASNHTYTLAYYTIRHDIRPLESQRFFRSAYYFT
jgi:hypothetical protein